jgi:hypothetical protein
MSINSQRWKEWFASGCAVFFCVGFLLFWTAGTLHFDIGWAAGVIGQLRALRYVTAEGRVEQSAVKQEDSGDSTSYSVEIRYQYEVAGRRYHSDRFRYGDPPTSGEWAHEIVAARPAGVRVAVYYNPQDPADAVLLRGIDSGDLFMALFLTPPNVGMLGLWYVVGLCVWASRLAGPTAGGRLIQTPEGLRVRFHDWTPLIVVAITLFAAPLAAVLVLAFAIGHPPPMGWSVAALCLCYGMALERYVRAAIPIWAGRKDLVIGAKSRRLSLPQVFGRTRTAEVAFADLASIDVDEEVSTDTDGEKQSRYVLYVRWRHQGDDLRSGKLVEWGNHELAESFADWLRREVGLTSES